MALAQWAEDLASSLLSRQLPRRWVHVQGVARRTNLLKPLLGDEADLLAAAAFVHDIGYSPELVKTGLHGLDGAEYLAKIGAPQRLCGLVAFHSAAWRDAELCGLTSRLERFPDEDSLVRDGLWWADMTTGPDGQLMTFPQRMAEVRERLGIEHLASRGIERSWEARKKSVDSVESRLELLSMPK